MPIKPIDHYSLSTPASVYDEEALTALELAARTAAKVNEVIKYTNSEITKQHENINHLYDELPSNVAEWLEAHPEITTTVQAGEITEDKLHESLKKTVVNNYITPEMYGAKGDGVTDDTTAIQNAINSFDGKTGTVMLGAGQYRITNPITITSNINIKGVSSTKYGRYNSDIPSTVIFYDGADVGAMVKYNRNGATVFGGSISDLTLDGCKKVKNVIDLSKSGRITISDISIVGFTECGIYATYVYEHLIKDNWFSVTSGCGVKLDSIANANTVRDNAFEISSGTVGIWINGCNGNIITGNMIEGGVNGAIGIDISGGAYTSQNIITNNRIEFESHRAEGETEGICIRVGRENETAKPAKNYVERNALYNQVVLPDVASTQRNYKNEFVDYGIATVTDCYDNTVLNENPKMIVNGETLTSYGFVDNGFTFLGTSTATKISLTNAVYEYPVIYQAVDVKDLRGEDIALSCMMRVNDRAVSAGIEFYKGGTGGNWGTFGTYIKAIRTKPFAVGEYQLIHLNDIVPNDCDTAVITFNFGSGDGIPSDTDIDVKWCKLTRRNTWR